jgi:hypothetical protein
MKTLIEAVELWIDSKVESNVRPWLKDMEDIHIRDANRIAELERRVLELQGFMPITSDLNSRVAVVESRVQLYLDSPSPKADAGESMHEADQMLSELVDRVDDMDSRLDDVESSVEDKIDTCDADQMVDIAVNDIDLESQIIDAVQAEINAIDFKITVER